jgi:hypothetical protein
MEKVLPLLKPGGVPSSMIRRGLKSPLNRFTDPRIFFLDLVTFPQAYLKGLAFKRLRISMKVIKHHACAVSSQGNDKIRI